MYYESLNRAAQVCIHFLTSGSKWKIFKVTQPRTIQLKRNYSKKPARKIFTLVEF